MVYPKIQTINPYHPPKKSRWFINHKHKPLYNQHQGNYGPALVFATAWTAFYGTIYWDIGLSPSIWVYYNEIS
jgi:hypothetical protein